MSILPRLAHGGSQLALWLLPAVLACSSGEPLVIDNPCAEGTTMMPAAPVDLRCTGLYENWESKLVARNVRPFSPGTVLWSDGAHKERWISLPDARIDTSDPDDWVFPVGTKLWKQFSLGGRRVETRMFAKVRDDRWVRATYLWSADGTRAIRTDRGVANFEGTGYTIPSTGDCDKCHEGRRDRVLGFEALGLSEPHAGGLKLDELISDRRLEPAVDMTGLQALREIPQPARAALSWLHVNCGTSCHNRGLDSTANSTGLLLRLEEDQLRQVPSQGLQALDTVRTTLGVRAVTGKWASETRITPGAPDKSLLFRLVTSRGAEQMPPILSHLVDPDGARILREWITSLGGP